MFTNLIGWANPPLGKRLLVWSLLTLCLFSHTFASSHREAPLIANDPLADNTDLYAFRSPDDPNTITIIANYIPAELPYGGPNYYSFGENIRYEIHIDNDASVPGDEIIYRFTFQKENEDPTTFFNIRLGMENLRTSYTMERSMDGGLTFETVLMNGIVPPANIGPRSIEGPVGLGSTYDELMQQAILNTTSGEKVFCGPVDDPFFVDLGGIFDLGNSPRQGEPARDGLGRYNTHAIAIQVPIQMLLKDGAPNQPTSILDSDYVIGVWASASRRATRVLDSATGNFTESGDWVQVSRLGMPLTNEVVIPIGDKDYWNSITPYEEITDQVLDPYFYNPELALYMDDDQFGAAVPAFSMLRIQTSSLGAFDFSNGADGLFGLKGSPAVAGTALDDAVFGTLLLPGPGQPRSVDLWPAFHTGVPNVVPYQLATGKGGNPLAPGKPFVNNFLPNGGDMLRLNMAVPVTDRTDPAFSSLGLIQAAVIGLTDPAFANTDIEFIPNMDGFPNGRRLEDDVTRIELQAVAGVVLAAVGLWYDDFDPDNSASPVTEDLLNVISFTTGVESNDKPFNPEFPYLAMPWRGTEVGTDLANTNTPEPPVQPDPATKDFTLYVSNTATPGIGVYQPGVSDVANADRQIATALEAGNGVFVDEASNTLFQVGLTASTVKIYAGADVITGTPTPITSFTDPAISSGREIAYDAGKDILYVASNSDSKIFVYEQPTSLSGMVSADRTLELNGEPWGISLDVANDRLYVAKDKTNMFQVYDNISTADGMVMPTYEVGINGGTRTHGITYNAMDDVLVVTEIGAASGGSFAEDGGLYVFQNVSDLLMGSPSMATPDFTIAGPMTLMGNPVDVDYQASTDLIFVAEKTKGGSLLVFNADDSGNVTPLLAKAYPDVPEAIYYAASTNSIYASNAANPGVGVFEGAFDNFTMPMSTIASNQADGNGVFRDAKTGNLFQLSRADKRIKIYNEAGFIVTEWTDDAITSGREIAYDPNRDILYIASNSDAKILSYLNPYGLSGEVNATRTLQLNGEPWGITFDATNDRLFVAKDKTAAFQVYNQPHLLNGVVMPDAEIAIDGAIRVHGITYSEDKDVLVVTEIGAASGGNFNMDGGYFLIKEVSAVIESGATTVTPDNAVLGAATMLGNPVDVAIDDTAGSMYIYLAEKTNGGSLVVFDAQADGNASPVLFVRYPAIPEALYLDTSNLMQ